MFHHYAIAGTEEQVAGRIAEIVPLIDELIVHPVGSAGLRRRRRRGAGRSHLVIESDV